MAVHEPRAVLRLMPNGLGRLQETLSMEPARLRPVCTSYTPFHLQPWWPEVRKRAVFDRWRVLSIQAASQQEALRSAIADFANILRRRSSAQPTIEARDNGLYAGNNASQAGVPPEAAVLS